MAKQKVSFPISLKLLTIFTLIVVLIMGVITTMISTLVRDDEQIKAEENNFTINQRTSEIVKATFMNVQSTATGFFNAVVLSSQTDILFEDYCRQNENTIFVYGPYVDLKVNKVELKDNPDAEKNIRAWLKSSSILKNSLKSGEIEIINISSLFKAPVICILFSYPTLKGNETAAIGISAEDLSDYMASGSHNDSFLVNPKGDILVHSDLQKVLDGENISDSALIDRIRTAPSDNGQFLMSNEAGEKYFYAFRKTFNGMMVITSISEKDVFEVINRTTYRIILFSIAIFFFSIIIIRLFSKGLTSPIRDLADAAIRIGKGDYNVGLSVKTHDEVGLLTARFMEMTMGLKERARLMATFSKFTNRVIAERAAKGLLKLGGETREATIFFSDIRSFTAMSEKLTPQEVVEFLNQYMTRMVACVNKTNGIVDKYIGDAIMAVWGCPVTAGSAEQDAWNGVCAALLMRASLHEFNQIRAEKGLPPVKIGCGLNTGPVVAGQIGSNDRMEYTVIGDAVNFASRTESLNKPFCTDILITENTYKYVKDKIIAEEMPSVHVKGKEAPARMYAVVNGIGLKGPKTIEELRAYLGVDTPDLGKVNTDEEEKKYSFETKSK